MIVEDPYWVARGRRAVTVPSAVNGTAKVLAMTAEQLEQARQREADRQPLGFAMPDTGVDSRLSSKGESR